MYQLPSSSTDVPVGYRGTDAFAIYETQTGLIYGAVSFSVAEHGQRNRERTEGKESCLMAFVGVSGNFWEIGMRYADHLNETRVVPPHITAQDVLDYGRANP